ncbi:MAG TPA: FAD-dependent 5-carboxymethylaminomethyl-2-thiouridine(34) oxidoreductase MnmC, partial [Pseudomonadaceae bacterium]|nr:FAD-dependent 5-carboxymethylaminomethyl-2-thiouridine(34) oxidoreductase MnmC [Pseudomonadaceae bacterium]
LHFKPATADSVENRFNLYAWLYASRFYRDPALPAEAWSPCGVMQVAPDARLQKRLSKLVQSDLYDPEILQVLDAEQASHLAGTDIEHSAAYFPAAGWLNPKALCAWYARHPGISVRCNSRVLQVEALTEGWQLQVQGPTEQTLLQCRHVILCNALDVHTFGQARHIPVIGNRGQVDSYRGAASASNGPVICGQGYLIPPRADGVQCIGGSFFVTDSKDQQAAASALHLQQLAAISAPLAAAFTHRYPSEQRRASRCTVADRMPVCGLLSGSAGTEGGLWVNVAHGSQGLARTPVCATLLDSHINRTPSPLEACVQEVLAAERFSTV